MNKMVMTLTISPNWGELKIMLLCHSFSDEPHPCTEHLWLHEVPVMQQAMLMLIQTLSQHSSRYQVIWHSCFRCSVKTAMRILPKRNSQFVQCKNVWSLYYWWRNKYEFVVCNFLFVSFKTQKTLILYPKEYFSKIVKWFPTTHTKDSFKYLLILFIPITINTIL